MTSVVLVRIQASIGTDEPPAEARLVIQTAEASAPAEWSETVPLADGAAEVRTPLDPSRRWEIQASAEGFWSPVVAVPPDSNAPLDLVLWPAADLEAAFTTPEEGERLEEVRVRLVTASETRESVEQPEEAQVLCEIENYLTEACRVPAGSWHLRLQAPGFAPHALWNQRIRAPAGLDLGEIALRRGGSIVGRVVTTEGPADPRLASVELRPVLPQRPRSAEEERRLEQLTRSAKLNPWGYFQFVGVAAGSYRLVAGQPGYVEAVQSGITADPEMATELEEPLVLRRPVRLGLQVEPAAGPFGDPWRLRLHEDGGSEDLAQVGKGTTDETGYWRSPPLRPGDVFLEVLDPAGNRVAWRELEVGSDDDLVSIELPLAYVEGRVLLDEDPLEATLWFGGRTGSERVEVQSDADGGFFVVLPRDGEWTVDVAADEPHVVSRGLEVHVEPDPGLRLAEVLIDVPDTSLSGEVVDEVGIPVPSVGVRLSSYGEWRGLLGTTTDEHGRFEVHGMRPGPYSVEARSGDRRSSPIQMTVAEGLSPFLRLTLRNQRPLAGRVVSASGPVPEARVVAYPVTNTGQPATMAIPEARTDVEGRFRLEIPGSTIRVRLLVLVPGYTLAIKEVTEGERLLVQLSRDGGTLRLRTDEDTDRQGEFGIVMVQGEPVDLPRLSTWARMNGSGNAGDGELAVPAMPPGTYAYCRLRLDEALMVMGEAAVPSADACSSGYLPVGGSLEL